MRLLTIFLSFALLGNAGAETSGLYTYEINPDNVSVTITDYPTSATGAIEIPAIIDGNSVTSIGDGAFYSCTGLTSITIPGSVTSIGVNAFLYCSSLTSITIPSSVTSIGDGAFYSCTGLTSITIPDSVTSIGDGAFYSCTGLTSITIPDSVTSIGDDAFAHCFQGYDLIVPESVTSIGKGAFWGSQPTSILIHFRFYENLISIGLESYYVESGVITNFIYDEKTDALFYFISGGEVSISGCTQDVSGEMVIPSEIEGYPVTRIDYFEGTRLTSIVVPEGVAELGDNAFLECLALETITLPGSMNRWGSGVFSGCVSLKEITIPRGISYIDDAFNGCVALSSVVIPNTVTGIGPRSFLECNSLTYLDLPESCEDASLYPFGYEGSYLVHVRAPWQAGVWLLMNGFRVHDPAAMLEIYYPNIEDVLTYEIQDDQVTITGCDRDALLKFEIPETISGLPVTTIAIGAFADCNLLTEVIIPNTVTSIGERAFDGCDNLKIVNIPEGVTRIEAGAFRGNDLSITIPESVTFIADGAILSNSCIFEGDAPTNTFYDGIVSNQNYYFQGAEGFSESNATELPSIDIDSDGDAWPDALEILLQTDTDDPSDFIKTKLIRDGAIWYLELKNFNIIDQTCRFDVEKTENLGSLVGWEPVYGWYAEGPTSSIIRIPNEEDTHSFYRVKVSYK